MNVVGHRYSVSSEIELTRDELDICLFCSARHYDGKCKAAGQVGGFLYGLRNMLGEEESVRCVLSSDNLQTLTKILEYSTYTGSTDKVGLYWQMYRALRTNIETCNALNNSLTDQMVENLLT